MHQEFKLFIVVLAVFIMTLVSFSAFSAEKPISKLQQLEEHALILETKYNKFKKNSDLDKKVEFIQDYLKEVTVHLKKMENIVKNDRSLGLKSAKSRMQKRMKQLLVDLKKTIDQMQYLVGGSEK